MKKYIIITATFIGGLVLGYLVFGSDSDSKNDVHNHADADGQTQMWTCSMHPQIMQPEPGACPICGMDLIPADASADGLGANQFKMTENAMALANIQTLKVGGDVAEGAIKLSGKIEKSEKSSTVQTAHYGGRIEKMYVNYTGEKIYPGQLLALIYSPELIAAQQELITAAKLRKSQPDLFNAVKNKLKFWKLTDDQIENILYSGEVRENIRVYADGNGVVTEKLVQEGDHVQQGQGMYKLSDLRTVWAEFDVYENQISAFKTGQSISIQTNAFPGKEFKAKISFIDPVMNNATRTVTIRAELDNKEGLFKPGMFVEGFVASSNIVNSDIVISVPKSAVLWTGKRSVVYVRSSQDQPVFEMREVQLGNAVSDDEYVVTSGLETGEEVVVNGTFTIDAAAQLQGKKSMMNRKEDKMAVMQMNFSDAFQKDFKAVLNHYLKLKDALVASDGKEALVLSGQILKVLQDLDIKSLSKMENQHLGIIKEMLGTMADNDNIEQQRAHFKMLSENMIAMVSNMKQDNGPLYIQYCPMADSNKGAYWISREEEVKNPYYGEAMLTCGEVKRVIQ